MDSDWTDRIGLPIHIESAQVESKLYAKSALPVPGWGAFVALQNPECSFRLNAPATDEPINDFAAALGGVRTLLSIDLLHVESNSSSTSA